MPKGTRSTTKARRAPASSAADLERLAKSRSGSIPKVQPNMAATRGDRAAETGQAAEKTDAQTRDYIDRSRKDLEFLKSKRADAPAHAAKSREAIDKSRETLSQVEKAATNRVAANTARYEKLAREHGADLSEDDFNAILKKAAPRK